MDDVARAAGVSKGGLYFHFPSKESLLIAVIERENDAIEDVLQAVGEGEASLAEAIDKLAVLALRYLGAHPQAAQVSECAIDEALRNPAVAEALRGSDLHFIGWVERLVERARTRGELPPDVDPAVVSRAWMVVLEGVKSKFLQFPEWPWSEVVAALRTALLAVAGATGAS